jgi:hypothetical protein
MKTTVGREARPAVFMEMEALIALLFAGLLRLRCNVNTCARVTIQITDKKTSPACILVRNGFRSTLISLAIAQCQSGLFEAWRLRSNSAISSTFTFSPPCAVAIPSLIIFKQNGQAVARVRAPVAMASSERKTETRCDGASSNHIRPPPAPQQNVFFPQRGISRYCGSLAAPMTVRVVSTSPLARAR